MRKFYDIHYHLFDLSHPNLLAFILRDDLISKRSVKSMMREVPCLVKFLPVGIAGLFPGRIAGRIRNYIKSSQGSRSFRNLLSVMENVIEYHFLYNEYYILQDQKISDNDGRMPFDKLVICPLLMDFGYKNINNSDCFYSLPPGKPVAKQVMDLIIAEWFYYNYDVIPHPGKAGKLKLIRTVKSKEQKFFEIYPFLGLNTANYDLREIKVLFDKYFTGYENDILPGARQSKLYSKLGTVKVDLEDLIFRTREAQDPEYYTYIFAGIKLYPPMGFDPWPEGNKAEAEKVRFLYSECIRKKIPVTVHCSDGGFVTDPKAEEFTNPLNRWSKVISNPEYKDLKLNFAHMGNQSDNKREWLGFLLSSMQNNRNIYTDCSCITPGKDDYISVKEAMMPGTEENILFGTDFVINLLWSGSYNDYLNSFLQTGLLDIRQKDLMSSINPERFLFG